MRRKLRIPQIAAVMGMCVAGGAYLPALSDVIIMVEGTSFMGLGGPNSAINHLSNAPFTRFGPPRPMKLVPSTIDDHVGKRGQIRAAATHIPITAAICGMRNFRRMSEL